MKARHFWRNLVSFVLTLCLMAFVLPVLADAAGVTPAEINTMAIDPQTWKLHRDMTWHDIKPNPVIDWDKELNPQSLRIDTPRMQATGRKINGALILIDYLDRKFISGQPKGSDPLGFYLFNTELAGEEGKQHGSYEENISINPVVTIQDYPQAYPNGYADLPRFWADFLSVVNMNDTQKLLNYGATVDTYWMENSYGKWGAELDPKGIYTIPYFEFEVMSSGYQTYRDVPPTFRYANPGQASPQVAVANDPIRGRNLEPPATEVAKRGGVKLLPGETETPWGIPEGMPGLSEAAATNFDDYDFFFWLHAGYDESGAWQEFGQLQYPTRQDIPWALGPGPRLLKVEKFFNDYPQWVPIYAARYENGWANYTGEWHENNYKQNDAAVLARVNSYRESAFWEETLARYNEWVAAGSPAGGFVFRLPQEDWDWANAYHGKEANEGRPEDAGVVDSGLTDNVGQAHTVNTRYVEFTSWESAVGEWSHSTSVQSGDAYGRSGGVKNTIPGSTQGENDAMGTFAHEFGHVADIRDNYSNPWSRNATPLTEPWEIMSRGSFSGPFGDHARWGVLPIEGASAPSNATHNLKTAWNFFDEGDLLQVNIEDLAASTPVVANVVARNVPLESNLYPDINVPRYDPATGEGFVKGMRLEFGTGVFADQGALTAGYTNFHYFDRTDTSASPRSVRMSVEVVDQSGNDSFQHDSGVMLMRIWNTVDSGHSIVDSHLYDIGMTDYFLGGAPSIYTVGHATQLADALFKAGKSMTDTGYYTATRNGSGEIDAPGSEWRWEPRGNRVIAGGDSVNEWYDEYNKVHFYILSKHMNPANHGSFLSYEVAMRHDDGTAVGGELNLSVTAPAETVDIGNYAKQTYALTNNGAETTDIVRIELGGELAAGRTEDIVIDLTMRNQNIDNPAFRTQYRTVPKFFNEQNAVILNDLYSLEPGEIVSFDVYIKQVDENTMSNLNELLTVSVSSETNADNSVTLGGGSGGGGEDDGGGCNAGYALLALFALPLLLKKRN